MNRFATATAAALAGVSRDTGQRLIVSDKSYPVVAGDFQTTETLTDAGIRKTVTLTMDILASKAPNPIWNIGTVGSYEGRAIRLTPDITKHANGAIYRLTWEAR